MSFAKLQKPIPTPQYDRFVPQAAQVQEFFLRALPLSQMKTITELGCGSGKQAAALLPQLPETAYYRGLELSPRLFQQSLAHLRPWGERASVSQIATDCLLPLPDASQDLLLCLGFLHSLRMDQFYMACAEARRIVRTGGYWALAGPTLGFASGAWEQVFRWRPSWSGWVRPLDLMHYISPEDWDLVREERFPGWLGAQALVLRRLGD